MSIMSDFEEVFDSAVHSTNSVPCPYPDAYNPANWELYLGRQKNIPDGEVVLIYRESAMGGRAFRRCDQNQQAFIRQGGGRLGFGSVDAVWRYRESVNENPNFVPGFGGGFMTLPSHFVFRSVDLSWECQQIKNQYHIWRLGEDYDVCRQNNEVGIWDLKPVQNNINNGIWQFSYSLDMPDEETVIDSLEEVL